VLISVTVETCLQSSVDMLQVAGVSFSTFCIVYFFLPGLKNMFY